MGSPHQYLIYAFCTMAKRHALSPAGIRLLFSSSMVSVVIPDGKIPGLIALTRTRTPGRLNSCASIVFSCRLAALLELYLM